jgi:hypothetical protein
MTMTRSLQVYGTSTWCERWKSLSQRSIGTTESPVVFFGAFEWLSVVVSDHVLFVVGVMYSSSGCSDSEDLLVVGDLMGKRPPSVKVASGSLEIHDIRTSQNTMERERGFRSSRCAGRARSNVQLM